MAVATEVQRESASTATTVVDADEFTGLLKQSFRPRSERAATEGRARAAGFTWTGAAAAVAAVHREIA